MCWIHLPLLKKTKSNAIIDFIKEATRANFNIVVQTNLLLADPVKLAKVIKGVQKDSSIAVNLNASTPST